MAVALGAGPAIKIKDGGMLAHAGVKDWLIRTAEAGCHPVPARGARPRGPPTRRHPGDPRAGVPAGCVSIPTRYVHMPSEMVDIADVQGAVRLLVGALSGPIDIG